MPFQAGQVLDLFDAQERRVGRMTVARREGDLLFGRFAPGPAFAAVAQLFRDFEEAADAQALSVVDQLDAAIAALGLSLGPPDGSQRLDIQDVQIWNEGEITCRLRGPVQAPVNGSLLVREPGQPVQE